MRILIAALLMSLAGNAVAGDGYWYGLLGGWAYEARGSNTSNGERLDLQRDLHLKTTNRRDYALGFAPSESDPGWLPALDLGYVRYGQRGFQNVGGILPLFPATVADSFTEVNDFEASLRWPWRIGKFRLSGGLSLTRLDGVLVVSDADTGTAMRQSIDEIFPLLSLGASWQPLPALRFVLRGDYVQYQGQRAQALEASAHWRMLGPIGLEAGWRQRRYKLDSENEFGPYQLDARLSGARIGLRFEIPR